MGISHTAPRGSAIARLLRPLHCPHLVMRYIANCRFDAFAAGCLFENSWWHGALLRLLEVFEAIFSHAMVFRNARLRDMVLKKALSPNCVGTRTRK
jgi:hypothetical protein